MYGCKNSKACSASSAETVTMDNLMAAAATNNKNIATAPNMAQTTVVISAAVAATTLTPIDNQKNECHI